MAILYAGKELIIMYGYTVWKNINDWYVIVSNYETEPTDIKDEEIVLPYGVDANSLLCTVPPFCRKKK